MLADADAERDVLRPTNEKHQKATRIADLGAKRAAESTPDATLTVGCRAKGQYSRA